MRYALVANNENGLGIEYVKEISIGYKNDHNLKKWKELISPSELINNMIWQVSNMLEFHFIKSNIREVQSITFKVKSLEKAKRYLLDNNLIGSFIDKKSNWTGHKLLVYLCILLKMNDYITKYSHVSDHTSQCAGKSSTILDPTLNIIRINCTKTSIFRTLVGG